MEAASLPSPPAAPNCSWREQRPIWAARRSGAVCPHSRLRTGPAPDHGQGGVSWVYRNRHAAGRVSRLRGGFIAIQARRYSTRGRGCSGLFGRSRSGLDDGTDCPGGWRSSVMAIMSNSPNTLISLGYEACVRAGAFPLCLIFSTIPSGKAVRPPPVHRRCKAVRDRCHAVRQWFPSPRPAPE